MQLHVPICTHTCTLVCIRTCTNTHIHSHTSPVAIGRFIMGLFWLTNPPEIYTAAIGLYSLWLLIRVSTSLYSYVTEGAIQLMTQVAFWAIQTLKCAVAGFLLFVVVPLLLGHLVDLFLLSPLRVPTDRTPIFYASTVSKSFFFSTKSRFVSNLCAVGRSIP